MRDLSGTTAIVTGASRGFGRAITISLADQSAHVVGVARSSDALNELHDQLGTAFTPEVSDVTDPSLPARLIAQHHPSTLILNAGAAPPVGPLTEQTWESFSTNWNTDVRHAFNFIRESLATPLEPGSVVISMSSGAAVAGSPLSGGYAGAKSMIRLVSSYAGLEASRDGSGIRFVAVLPQLTPATDLGRPYTAAYAQSAGISEAEFLERLGGTLTVDQVAEGISTLAADDSQTAAAYLLTTRGPQPIE